MEKKNRNHVMVGTFGHGAGRLGHFSGETWPHMGRVGHSKYVKVFKSLCDTVQQN